MKAFPLAEACHFAAVAAQHGLIPVVEVAVPDGLPDEARARSEFPVAEFVPVASPEGESAVAESEAEPIALSSQVDGLELPVLLAASLADACSLAQHSVACSDDSLAVEAELAAAPGAFLVVELLATGDYFPAARPRGYFPAHSVWAPHSDCFLALQVVVRLRDYFPALQAVVRRSDYSPVLQVVVRPRDCFLVLLVDSRVLQDAAPPDSEPQRYLPELLLVRLVATVVPE